MSNYKYEIKEPHSNTVTDLINNYSNEFLNIITLLTVAVITYLINDKILPKLNTMNNKLDSRKNKFNITAEDSGKVLSTLGALNIITKSFKSLLVLFHDKDELGYFTKYTIQYQVANNGYETLKENYADLDIRILDSEIQNMRNHNGCHIVYKRNYHLDKRMQQWMNKQNIVSAYAQLIYDSNNNEIGAVYLDFNREVDQTIITNDLTELIHTIEAIVSPYYLY